MIVTPESLFNGEHPPFSIGNCVVFLDGVRIEDVFYINTDRGFVERYKRYQSGPFKGHLIIADDEVVSEILEGEVELLTWQQCEEEYQHER